MTLNAAIELFRECKTADDVADVLAAHDITGKPNNPCHCPVAELLRKHTEGPIIVSNNQAHSPDTNQWVDLPSPVKDFIELFDEQRTRHMYAYLIEW